MAESLVDTLSDDFDPSLYVDEYQIELKKMLDDAIANGSNKVTRAPEPAAPEMDAEVVDLVAALQRSLEASGRKASAPAAAAKAEKPAAKKAAEKKPAKKVAKKAPAKQTRRGA